MAYSEEDQGFVGVSLVGIWILIMAYILRTVGLSELQTAGVMVPTCIAAFIVWVRRENAKIRKDEEAAKAAKAKKSTAGGKSGETSSEVKKDK